MDTVLSITDSELQRRHDVFEGAVRSFASVLQPYVEQARVAQRESAGLGWHPPLLRKAIHWLENSVFSSQEGRQENAHRTAHHLARVLLVAWLADLADDVVTHSEVVLIQGFHANADVDAVLLRASLAGLAIPPDALRQAFKDFFEPLASKATGSHRPRLISSDLRLDRSPSGRTTVALVLPAF